MFAQIWRLILHQKFIYIYIKLNSYIKILILSELYKQQKLQLINCIYLIQ